MVASLGKTKLAEIEGKCWGHGHEDTFPVAQFEQLWCDTTAIPEIPCSFFAVPVIRGQQL